jgi:epoxyqueuosine reductase
MGSFRPQGEDNAAPKKLSDAEGVARSSTGDEPRQMTQSLSFARDDPSAGRRLIVQPILAKALALGFDAVGVAKPEAILAAGERLEEFLNLGRHGEMHWMAANRARRRDPKALWPEARSAIVVAMNYGSDADPPAELGARDRGLISVYARGADYHDVIKKKLKILAGWLRAEYGAEAKVFVDTAPVMEKPLAQAAGIGWQGKHTNLVSRQFGSWLFLGCILTSLDLDPTVGEADHCGECRACLDICPTRAMPAPYQLDARRCISYLTIEHKGTIAREFRAAIGNRIYGCDDCLAVCPWNKFAKKAREMALLPRSDLTLPCLADLAKLDDTAFRSLFKGTAVKRLGRDRFVRNVAIALGNSAEPEAIPVLENLLNDRAPLVRAMAVWALLRLLPRRVFENMRRLRLAREHDEDVRAEWLAEDAVAGGAP